MVDTKTTFMVVVVEVVLWWWSGIQNMELHSTGSSTGISGQGEVVEVEVVVNNKRAPCWSVMLIIGGWTVEQRVVLVVDTRTSNNLIKYWCSGMVVLSIQ